PRRRTRTGRSSARCRTSSASARTCATRRCSSRSRTSSRCTRDVRGDAGASPIAGHAPGPDTRAMTTDAWEEAEEAGELLREGDHDAAIVEAERVLATNPKNEYAWFFLGGAHFEKGEHTQALKAYVKALEVAPHYTGALVSLGHTLRVLGRLDE